MSDKKLKALADRIERLMDERDGIQSDIRDIYAEAKSNGYVPKVLRKAITRKRMDPSKRDEEDTILDLYEDALSPAMRKAVAMAANNKSAREIEAETGIDQATVARSVSLNKKSETNHDADAEEITDAAPQPESVGDDASMGASPQPAPEGGVGTGTSSTTGDAQGEGDASLNLRVSEADRRADDADGEATRGGGDLRHGAGRALAGGPGQDVRHPQPPLECDVGERGDYPPAGRDAADVASPEPEVARVAPPAPDDWDAIEASRPAFLKRTAV